MCKTVLARESGVRGVLFDEKKSEGRKSHGSVPLSKAIKIKM
jgi:hypothetical protein